MIENVKLTGIPIWNQVFPPYAGDWAKQPIFFNAIVRSLNPEVLLEKVRTAKEQGRFSYVEWELNGEVFLDRVWRIQRVGSNLSITIVRFIEE